MVIEVAFIVTLMVGLAVFFWIIVRNVSRKISGQYEKLAYYCKIEMTQPEPRLLGFLRPEPFVHGLYNGREMSISVASKGLQNTRQIETVLKVKVDEKAFNWQMTTTGLFGGLRQRDSGTKERWSSGDSAFDTSIDIRTNDGERLRRILPEKRRNEILRILKKSKASIYLRDGVLSFTEFGLIANDETRERFEEITDFFCLLAEEVEAR
jgi:hypothetical protein